MNEHVRARLVLGTVLLGPICAGLVIQQWDRYEVARETFRDARAHAGERLNQARAAESRARELAQETDQTAADLARLEQILPAELDPDAFAAQIKQRAEAAKVRLVENDFRYEDGSEPPSGTMSAVLKGSEDDVRQFTDRIHRWTRLVKYQELDRGEGWRLCMLTTWAAPAEEDEEADEPSIVVRMPWLPPFPNLLAQERAKAQGAVDDMKAHRDVLAKVRRFERLKKRLQTLVDLINDLKESQVEAAAKKMQEKAGS